MSMSEKQPLLVIAHPELQLDDQQLADHKADRRRRVARHIKLAVLFALFNLFGLFFFFSTSSFSFSFSSALSTPLQGPLVLPEGSQCSSYNGGSGLKTYPLATFPLAFDSQHGFSFRQNATRHDEYSGHHWRHVYVSGEVVVRKAAPGKKPSVDVEALSNDDRIDTAYAYAASAQSLDVTVDDRIWIEAAQDPAYSRGMPCLVVRATVWLPEVAGDSGDHTTRLKSLLIANTHLGIQLLDDVDLVVDEVARLFSVVGSIAASRAQSAQSAQKPKPKQKPHWYSKAVPAVTNSFGTDYRFEAPETDVKTTSGSISGPWTLVDRLHFGSVSGPVHVAVAPEGVLSSGKVADLSLQTISGSIAFEEIARAPSSAGTVHAVHPYTLSVSSRSGTIRGTGTFARSARLHSTSSSIKVTLQPVALDEDAADTKTEKAVLETNTVSGSTEVHLLDAATGTRESKTLDFLKSVHITVSGSMKLHYPASWAGSIHLTSTASGSLAVEGKGVHVQPGRSPRWPHVRRHLEAVKDVPEGDGAAHTELSNVVAKTVSASIRLSFP